MSDFTPSADTTAVVVIGASKWPDAPQFESAPQFLNSADAFSNFMISPEGGRIDRNDILNLFDSDDEQPVLVRRIAEFLQKKRQRLAAEKKLLTDVITYYVGHGGFDTDSNSSYFLAIRKTNPIDYLGSSLSAASLKRALREHAGSARHYLILDCCFAAAAVGPYIQMSAAAQAAVSQVQDSFPPSGTALLCAAGARMPAKAKRDATYTMFSEGMLEALTNGAPQQPQWLTVTNLAECIRTILRDRYLDEAVRPEVHCPDQSGGNVANVPLFRNHWSPENLITGNPPVSEPPERAEPSTDIEHFVREFEETDDPAQIGSSYIGSSIWAQVPKPVKSLLKELESLERDKFDLLKMVVGWAVLLHVVAAILVVLKQYVKVNVPIGLFFAAIIPAALFSIISTGWLCYYSFVMLKGVTSLDRRTLRPEPSNAAVWEKEYIMSHIRKPRILIRVGQYSFLKSRVIENIKLSLIGPSIGGLFWALIYLLS